MFIWGNRPLTFPAIFSIGTVKIFNIRIQTEPLACIIIGIIIMIGLHLFMTRTKFGTAMRAAAMDPTAAKACGIDVSLSTGITWGLAAGVAAVGGMFAGPIYGVFTVLGVNIGRKSFTSAVIGGYGNMYGAIAGGMALGLVETLVAGYISSAYKDLIAYLLLIIFLFIKPTGIFNEKAINDE
jgi:branched-chain amino acid transport system permease protein